MNQPMDYNAMIQGYFLGAAVRMTGMVMLDFIFNILPCERERMRETLNREPTVEDWDDLSQFLGERTLIPRCLQRAEDRKKIRCLMMREDNAADET